jgi:8-oxo-dGTP diphosphatase
MRPRPPPPRTDPSGEDESQFLAQYDPGAFEHPSVSVDVVLLTVRDGGLASLVCKRASHPHKGRWSLPGGFIGMGESLDQAATRVLRSKGGLSRVWLEQLYTFGALGRDPRTRVISIAYYALIDAARLQAVETSDALALARVSVPWEGEAGGPVELLDEEGEPLALAFDHADILGMAVRRIRGKLDWAPIGFQLLPREFTLLQLQNVHQAILGRTLNKDSFRRRMLASDLLRPTGTRQAGVGHRPAELFRFTQQSAV